MISLTTLLGYNSSLYLQDFAVAVGFILQTQSVFTTSPPSGTNPADVQVCASSYPSNRELIGQHAQRRFGNHSGLWLFGVLSSSFARFLPRPLLSDPRVQGSVPIDGHERS